jgi:hypothetical protein
MRFNTYFILIFFTATLPSCTIKQQGSHNDAHNSKIIGSWTFLSDNDCWHHEVEYLSSGEKIVTMEYCDDSGRMITSWYHAKWSISGSHIKEEIYYKSGNDGIMTVIKVPSIEIDEIILLNEDQLIIRDPRMDAHYKRKK